MGRVRRSEVSSPGFLARKLLTGNPSHANNSSTITKSISNISLEEAEVESFRRYKRKQSESASDSLNSLESASDLLLKSTQCKSVRFADLEIRSYEVIVGDHPSCAVGCPLSLGWEYDDQSQIVSVDDFESHRGPRRHKNELRLSVKERNARFVSDDNDKESQMEVRRACRRLQRSRDSNLKLCSRRNQSFFCDPVE